MKSNGKLPEERRAICRTTPLKEGFARRVGEYAAAAAAGIGILGTTPPAEAEIIYTPAHVALTFNGAYETDLNHDGQNDFTLYQAFSAGIISYFLVGFKAPAGVKSNGVLVSSGGFAAPLNRGALIGPRSRFSHAAFFDGVPLEGCAGFGPSFCTGPWKGIGTHYVGLKFQVNGQTYYGWARASVNTDRSNLGVILTGYAYNTVPNQPLRAGVSTTCFYTPSDCADSDSPQAGTVGEGTLGALAQGSSGRR
jgi:hypothetical protein